jgi:hypothetical protein
MAGRSGETEIYIGGKMNEFVVNFLRGALLGAIVVALVTIAIGVLNVAFGQSILWRLIDTQINWGQNTVTCTYEGRLSDGRTTIVTNIVRGSFCPQSPGSQW